MGSPIFPARLFADAVEGVFRDVFIWVLDSHQARFRWVFELVVRAFYAHQHPAILFELFDDVFAVHCSYYNH